MEASAQEEDVSPLLVNWQSGDTVRARLGPRRVVHGRIVQYTNGEICSFRDRDQENIYYYVKTTTKRKVWAPSSGLSVWVESNEATGPGHTLRDLDGKLEEKSLPVNNSDGKVVVKAAASNTASDGKSSKQKKKKFDHLVPLTVSQRHAGDKLDLNVEYELRTTPRTSKQSNQYKDFLRRGKDFLYDKLHDEAMSIKDLSPDDPMKKSTKVEMHHYLSNVWRYIHNCKLDYAKTTYESEASVDSDEEDSSPDPLEPLTVHISWCVVCGKFDGNLLKCGRCPVSYHELCRGGWSVAIRHRKELTSKPQEQVGACRLRKTAVGCSKGSRRSANVCPVCVLGPGVTYGDIVWHKLKRWPWWPARVVPPGELPSCLINTRKEQELTEWPLEFYDNPRQYTWAPERRICLLTPTHYDCVATAEPELREAFMEASDDYISTYLT